MCGLCQSFKSKVSTAILPGAGFGMVADLLQPALIRVKHIVMTIAEIKFFISKKFAN